MSNRKGAFPEQMIRDLISAKMIIGAVPQNVKPSSLDLTISEEIYSVDGVLLPSISETVREILKHVKAKKHRIGEPLLVDKIYLARLNETLDLPSSIYAFVSPKSTTGRLDIHVRLLSDFTPRYDTTFRTGYKGELWALIIPRSFNILLYKGVSLNQIRFFDADTRFSETELRLAVRKHKLLWSLNGMSYDYDDLRIREIDGSLIFTLDLSQEVSGYVAIKTKEVIDLKKVGSYDPRAFFKPIPRQKSFYELERNKFYILSTAEAVRLPPTLAGEVISMDDRSGDFRTHYAGFVDPGWGWGKEGEGRGRPITLEVRPFENLYVRHGQPISKFTFERLVEAPDTAYDSIGTSNYVAQDGPQLAKYFKKFK